MIFDQVFEVDCCRLPHFHWNTVQGYELQSTESREAGEGDSEQAGEVAVAVGNRRRRSLAAAISMGCVARLQHHDAVTRLLGGLFQECLSLLDELLQPNKSCDQSGPG